MLEMNELRTALGKGLVTVTFTKKDGETRTMTCTTKMSEIPDENHPKGKVTNLADDLFRVYDVDAKGWRSFHYDQVTATA